ncbi:MAG: SIMPL domain-containing protein [Oscillospiraceae bacterium]|nr:SIMPL domain-containing protein [Oscillospiraceae bacterium]
MGKLNIIGTAEKKISCNAMYIYLTFSVCEATASRASEKVMQNCDSFLKILQENQIAISEISLEETKTEKSYSKKEEYYSIRKIRFSSEFDIPLLNQFELWIQKVPFNVTLSTEFYISNMAEIRKELLRQAVEDSRQKAEMLANAMNQKLIGFEEVIMDRNFRNDDAMFAVPAAACSGAPRAESVSNALKAPEQTESERVEVVWNIE